MANKIEVLSEKCTGCSLCVKSCPFGAIVLVDRPEHPKKQKLAVIDVAKCNYCGACVDACKRFGAILMLKEEKQKAVDFALYKDVWVYAEQRHGEVSPVAYELLNEGRKLADKLKTHLCAVLLGDKIENQAQDLILHGADKVYVIDNPLLKEFCDDPYAETLAHLIREEKPEIVIMGATNIGRSFASRVAAKIDTGLTADCTALDVDVSTRNLQQTRPAFGGNIMATILTPRHRPQMATVRHKVFKRATRDTSRKGEIVKKNYDFSKLNPGGLDFMNRAKFLQFVADTTAKVNLSEADIIVSGGRGLGKPEGFKLIEELAETIGGAVGASRASVDSGWIPYSHQVGQTGRTVAPKIYIACGISGQIQHLVGMGSSEVIIAINRDPEAPMMKIATFALEGDLYEIIPWIIKEIKKSRGEIEFVK
ncbi:MAG: electron transfer flavoprotein subunit alpha [Elusimicrobia bacterium RIFOXYA2_FULL_39_19]|nr:MAG: electron transfer flavoprotein subunit alpha [Elusimicrobia bacterium RIFOXYA2_FULL_39_19]